MATCITTRSQTWALAAQPPLSPRYNPLSFFRSNWQGAEIINQFLCYTPITGTTFFNGLVMFSCFWSNLIFRLQTVRRISMRSHLSHALHTFPTHVCLMANLIDSSFTCCAWLCCHTHVHHTCSYFSSIFDENLFSHCLGAQPHKLISNKPSHPPSKEMPDNMTVPVMVPLTGTTSQWT